MVQNMVMCHTKFPLSNKRFRQAYRSYCTIDMSFVSPCCQTSVVDPGSFCQSQRTRGVRCSRYCSSVRNDSHDLLLLSRIFLTLFCVLTDLMKLRLSRMFNVQNTLYIVSVQLAE